MEEKVEEKMEEKMEEKVEEKMEEKVEEKMEEKVEEKMEGKIAIPVVPIQPMSVDETTTLNKKRRSNWCRSSGDDTSSSWCWSSRNDSTMSVVDVGPDSDSNCCDCGWDCCGCECDCECGGCECVIND